MSVAKEKEKSCFERKYLFAKQTLCLYAKTVKALVFFFEIDMSEGRISFMTLQVMKQWSCFNGAYLTEIK